MTISNIHNADASTTGEIPATLQSLLIPTINWSAVLIEESELLSDPVRLAEWDREAREAYTSFDGVLKEFLQDVLCQFRERVWSEQEGAAWQAADFAAQTILGGDATLDDIDATTEQIVQCRRAMLAGGTSILSLPTSSSLRRFRSLLTQMLEISYAQPAAVAN